MCYMAVVRPTRRWHRESLRAAGYQPTRQRIGESDAPRLADDYLLRRSAPGGAPPFTMDPVIVVSGRISGAAGPGVGSAAGAASGAVSSLNARHAYPRQQGSAPRARGLPGSTGGLPRCAPRAQGPDAAVVLGAIHGRLLGIGVGRSPGLCSLAPPSFEFTIPPATASGFRVECRAASVLGCSLKVKLAADHRPRWPVVGSRFGHGRAAYGTQRTRPHRWATGCGLRPVVG